MASASNLSTQTGIVYIQFMKNIHGTILNYPVRRTFKRYLLISEHNRTVREYKDDIHVTVNNTIEDGVFVRLVEITNPKRKPCRLSLELIDVRGNKYVSFRAIRMDTNGFIQNKPSKLNTFYLQKDDVEQDNDT
jgi:hypothetical protein